MYNIVCAHPLHSPGAVTNPGLLQLPSLAPASILRQGDTGGGGAGAASTLSSTQSQYMEVTWLPLPMTPPPQMVPPSHECPHRRPGAGTSWHCSASWPGENTSSVVTLPLDWALPPDIRNTAGLEGFHQSTCTFRVSELFLTCIPLSRLL